MMMNENLDSLWFELESQILAPGQSYQRLVNDGSLFRIYIGSSGIPVKRYLSIELPMVAITQFSSLNMPNGFEVQTAEPSVKHEGYAACVLQSAASDWNDVFTIVVQDILNELRAQKSADGYIFTLKSRIEKWRSFFTNTASNRLSDRAVIGLIGELAFINTLQENGVSDAVEYWNGPISAAQDLQSKETAVEIKSTVSHSLDSVSISSEIQLDCCERSALFLIVSRFEQSKRNGYRLQDYVAKVVEKLTSRQRNGFYAKLLCLGYEPEVADLYDKYYAIKEQRYYQVKEGFPRLLRKDLKQGVFDVAYRVSLACCETFRTDLQSVVCAFKEH